MYSVLNLTAPINGINNCGHIGHIVADFSQVCELANTNGFDAVNIDLNAVEKIGLDAAKSLMQRFNLKAASFGLPVDLFADAETFNHQLHHFERHAEMANGLDCSVVLTYLPPFSDTLNFNDLFVRTSDRLHRIKPILEKNKIKIGFEFIGPTETRQSTKYDFIHTIDGVRALIASSDLYGLAGFKLDIHHWQNSGAGVLDIAHLDLNYLLYIELNDGLKGYDIFTIPEFERELPFATGVTHIEGFLRALKKKGYQGPVAVEPWSQRIQDMPLKEAIGAVKRSLDKCLSLVRG
jgi:sugar phosphate isomerase/epimerase